MMLLPLFMKLDKMLPLQMHFLEENKTPDSWFELKVNTMVQTRLVDDVSFSITPHICSLSFV